MSKYTGMNQAMRKILAEEGIQALWFLSYLLSPLFSIMHFCRKGSVPGIFLYVMYTSIQVNCSLYNGMLQIPYMDFCFFYAVPLQ